VKKGESRRNKLEERNKHGTTLKYDHFGCKGKGYALDDIEL
jgi:hypothetical protein